jgi:membrane-associated phospholipid phosphatase
MTIVRAEARALLGFVALLGGVVPFLLMLLLVRQQWAPLRAADRGLAEALHREVSGSPRLVRVLDVVTDLGDPVTAVVVVGLATLWCLLRHRPRLAAYAATTGLGLAVLVPMTKALVGRDRPALPLPVVEAPSSDSFPSGHAAIAITIGGLLTLLLLSAAGRWWRAVLLAGAAAVALVVGFTRLALGVHFLSDVVAGWALGAAWLAVTTAAFGVWPAGRRQRMPP